MQIKQFEDKHLSHFSYAILSDREKKIVLIDPARNPQPYLDFAQEQGAYITGVIETHPHADFVSSHLELHQVTGATIYTSKLTGASYPHQPFDEKQFLLLGEVKLSAFNTPGHSPDSISIVLELEDLIHAVFTGDTLFIGDCGRPDLRESVGNVQADRLKLANQMYHSLRNKFLSLPDNTIVYPAHGAGSLCGKNLRPEQQSTIGHEKRTNWCLQESSEEAFIRNIVSNQPFIPQYFPFDVALNRKGAVPFKMAIASTVARQAILKEALPGLNNNLKIIDTRDAHLFKQGHLPHSVNLMHTGKFETWLGTLIAPGEKFYLVAENKEQLQEIIERIASIGYEQQMELAFIMEGAIGQQFDIVDINHFKNNTDSYTIVDVRNESEVLAGKIFNKSIPIPLPQLNNRIHEIPVDKPILVHCAGGFRSAAASSLIKAQLNGTVKVLDLGESIKMFHS